MQRHRWRRSFRDWEDVQAGCRGEPPPLLFLVIGRRVVTPRRLFEAFAVQLGGEDTSVKRARVLA